jgi:hypothetical protein
MSVNLSATAQIEFDSMVKAAYQTGGKLRAHVRVKTGVIGNTTRFRRSSRGVAQVRIPQTDIIPMNTSYVEPNATLADWHAADYTDVFDQQRTSIQERQIVAGNVGLAIARREDQIVIDALDAANASATIAVGGTGLTYAKLLAAQRFMNARGVPTGQRKLAISARGMEDLLGDNRFISSDFVGKRALETGELPPILGFNIIMIDDRDEGGLPLVTTTRTCFAWDMQALGYAVGLETETMVDWIPEKTSWLVQKGLTAGAVAIDPLGIIEIACNEP